MTAVSPLIVHWRYCGIELSQWYAGKMDEILAMPKHSELYITSILILFCLMINHTFHVVCSCQFYAFTQNYFCATRGWIANILWLWHPMNLAMDFMLCLLMKHRDRYYVCVFSLKTTWFSLSSGIGYDRWTEVNQFDPSLADIHHQIMFCNVLF